MNQKMAKFPLPPPWKQYPNSEPTWGGWRQGISEEWLHSVWLPFWRGLSQEQTEEYLQDYPPPTEEWRLYLTQFWR